MRKSRQAYRLMKLDARKRTFILDAMKYIEQQQEEHLYNYGGVSDINALRVDLKDIFFSVFATEEIKGNKIVTAWKNSIKTSATFQEVPEEFYFKSWEEIFEPMRQDPFKVTLLTNWLKALKCELEEQNYHVSAVYPTVPYLRIWWEE